MTELRRIWRAPAVQAALIQALSLLPMLALVFVLARAGVPVSYFGAAALQGLVAALLSYRLAPWWRAIQLLFPPALCGALALALPPSLFLAAFLFLLLLFWSTFRTQVPYYPSHARAWDAVVAALPQDRPLRVIDIGSGLGGFALDLARRRPDARVTGIELAPLPWLVSSVRARLSGSRARFARGDYDRLDFSAYDAVFAYLSPAAMPALWNKAAAEMRPASMLLSFEFDIPGHQPDRTLAIEGCATSVYVWHF
jgi:SAM-dependent methyltransferase